MVPIIDDFKMKVIKKWFEPPISKLKFEPIYQREIDPAHLRKVTGSIRDFGYWPNEVIVLNPNFEIVDGTHRVVGAKKNNLKKIPACICQFKNKECEAAFFWLINDPVGKKKLAPKDIWHAKYKAGNDVAKFLRKLEQHPMSMLRERIAMRNKYTPKAKFTIGDVLIMINIGTRSNPNRWKARDEKYISKALAGKGDDRCMEQINLFVCWFDDCFGSSKPLNPKPYSNSGFRAVAVLYNLLKTQGCLSNGNRKVVRKMKKFVFTSEFGRLPHQTKVQTLVNHYNYKLKMNRVEYRT